MKLAISILAGLLVAAPTATAFAQQVHVPGRTVYPGEEVGVALSAREARASQLVRLSNGQVALRLVGRDGIPWLYGLGETYGNASGKPTVDGVTPSQLANTPSGGLVPGQDPR